MGIPATFEALIIIVLILVPGFLFLLLSRGAIAHSSELADFRYLLLVVSTGVVLQAMAWPFGGLWIVKNYTGGTLDDQQAWALVWFLMVTIVWPVTASVIFNLVILSDRVDGWLNKMGVGYDDRLPTAWDYFLRRGPFWVKVYLKDDQVIPGEYGGVSKAGTSSKSKDLYLQQLWEVDEEGEFKEPLHDSGGAWIAYEAINFVEVIESAGGAYEQDGTRQAAPNQGPAQQGSPQRSNRAKVGPRRKARIS